MKKKKTVSILDAIPKPLFKKEWKENDFEKMEKKIFQYYRRIPIINVNGKPTITPWTWEEAVNLFGLTYTSSSSYAAYWVCNVELAHGSSHVIGFAIQEDGRCCGIAKDKNENEIIFSL